KPKKPNRTIAAKPAAAPAPALAAHRPGLRPRRDPAPVMGKGSSHAIQLGSFSSEHGARRAWGFYAGRNPELRNFKMSITPASVRGKKFWRVAAVGLDSRGAGGLCSKVKARGGVCFAYATTGRPATAPAYAAKAKAKAPVMVAARPKAGATGASTVRKK
ncbi:MAG: SPOR domain-containing protein, partial [Sphingomonadales bacterium]|nr:SPOR domain-containing protein [Sphingomonadales bacterium]